MKSVALCPWCKSSFEIPEEYFDRVPNVGMLSKSCTCGAVVGVLRRKYRRDPGQKWVPAGLDASRPKLAAEALKCPQDQWPTQTWGLSYVEFEERRRIHWEGGAFPLLWCRRKDPREGETVLGPELVEILAPLFFVFSRPMFLAYTAFRKAGFDRKKALNAAFIAAFSHHIAIHSDPKLRPSDARVLNDIYVRLTKIATKPKILKPTIEAMGAWVSAIAAAAEGDMEVLNEMPKMALDPNSPLKPLLEGDLSDLELEERFWAITAGDPEKIREIGVKMKQHLMAHLLSALAMPVAKVPTGGRRGGGRPRVSDDKLKKLYGQIRPRLLQIWDQAHRPESDPGDFKRAVSRQWPALEPRGVPRTFSAALTRIIAVECKITEPTVRKALRRLALSSSR